MHSKDVITAQALSGLREFLELKGLSADTIAKRFGLFFSHSSSSQAYVPFQNFCDLLQHCATQCGDDAFGAELSAYQTETSRGLFHYIVTNCGTLRAALVARAKYIRLFSTAYSTNFVPVPGGMACEWSMPPSFERPQILAYLAGTTLAKVRSILQAEWMPLAVEFTFEAPRQLKAYRRIFGSNVAFGCEVNRVLFSNKDLNTRLLRSDPKLLAEVEHFGKKLLGIKESEDSFVSEVRDLLIRNLPGDPGVEERVCRALRINPRTLQRRLAPHKTSFRQLVSETRKSLAAQLIKDTRLPFTQVAHLVGFSEASALSRAAKSWFGQTPSEMRRRADPHIE